MKTYHIKITETTIMIAGTTIKAESKELAEEIAREMYDNNEFEPHDEHFEVDMNNGGVDCEATEVI